MDPIYKPTKKRRKKPLCAVMDHRHHKAAAIHRIQRTNPFYSWVLGCRSIHRHTNVLLARRDGAAAATGSGQTGAGPARTGGGGAGTAKACRVAG